MSQRNELLRALTPCVCAGSMALLAALALGALLLLAAAPAGAALSPAVVIDGPSSSILAVDGAAMAPDGGGGILYTKLVEGQPHLFVARFVGGVWQPPIEVDAGQPFGASFPAIAAGNDGRLLVVWAEPWATIAEVTHYRLMSAAVEPGAQQFGPALPIEEIGDGTAAYPALTMAPDGIAYVAYRVVTNPLTNNPTILPFKPGDELVAVRVARYNGEGLPWTQLGTINNHSELPMRHPSASNAPAIGVALNGNAVVAWQEPDSTGVARIWARRIYGTRLGNVLEVSPTESGGRPIAAEADAPAIAVSGYGEAKIAYRLEGGDGSPYGGAKILLNTLPAETAPAGAKLTGAAVVGGAPTLGSPSVSIDDKTAFRLAYTGGPSVSAGSTMAVSGNETNGLGAPSALGPASGTQVATTINPAGGGLTVWSSTTSTGSSVVDAREDYAGGAWQQAQLAAPLSGPVSEPALGGSGQGDALIAFRQGPPGQPQVMAAVAKSPPGDFQAQAPVGWVGGNSATITWEPAPEAYGTTTYALVIDGQVSKSGLTGLSTHVNPHGLGNGVHQVQVLATDSLGQETMTPVAELKVDANPPSVSVRSLAHDVVRVRVYDRASGASASATSIDFGRGALVRGKLTARHTFAHPGRYEIVVRSASKVGIRLDAHMWVQAK
jgi:hypothetical protein